MPVDPSDTEIQNPETLETTPSAPAALGSNAKATSSGEGGDERPSGAGGGGENRVLETMLDRLYTSLLSGPALNCKPHNSRQRIDWTQLAALQDTQPHDALHTLLTDTSECRLVARVPMPEHMANSRFHKKSNDKKTDDEPGLTDEQRTQAKAYRDQQTLLTKLRSLTQDAATYEQDTGVHALAIGYPLLSIPPAVTGGRRILAPIAMVPADLVIKAGGKPGAVIRCAGDGNDRVLPNPALVAWVERETGQRLPDDLFGDDAGTDPWREINELVSIICERLELDIKPPPPEDGLQGTHHEEIQNSGALDQEAQQPDAEEPTQTDSTANDGASLVSAPRTDITPVPLADALGDQTQVIESAVLGLFPSSKQGLLRDTRDMLDAPPAPGSTPASAFIHPGVALDESKDSDAPANRYTAERFVTLADPFQAQTVKLSQTHTGLVVHGPPGTGKSQTITNIIGDHLARGQRVLFVCEKRTALDVVYNRLKHLGLADFCATVHDPQRDQRDLYMGIRAQLEDLADRKTHPRAAARVETIDAELTAIHDQLTTLHKKLMTTPGSGGIATHGSSGGGGSFHEQVGRWLSIDVDELPDTVLTGVLHTTLDESSPVLTRLFDRGIQLNWTQNPWQPAASRKPNALDAYLARRPDAVRQSLESLNSLAQEADRTLDLSIPDFDPKESLEAQAQRRENLGAKIKTAFAHPNAQAYATRITTLPSAERDSLIGRVRAEQPRLKRVRQAPLDTELKLTVQNDLPGLRTLNTELATLDAYLKAISSWTGIFAFGLKKQAKLLLTQYGLAIPDKASADQLVTFLNGIKDRILLEALRGDLCGDQQPANPTDDEPLCQTIECFDHLLGSYALAEEDATLKPRYLQALAQDNAREALLEGLERSGPRAQALQTLEAALANEPLLDADWQTATNTAHRKASAAAPTLQALVSGFNDVDPALRLLSDWHGLPNELQPVCSDLLNQGVESEIAFDTLSKRVLGHQIRATLAADPELLRTDAHDLSALFDRFEKLQDEKRSKVRDAIEHQWVEKQKERLLVGTGSRLNSLGASTRQRLYVRGSRAMRLRQVLHLGQVTSHEDGGGDPLFDLCPVWLCSPETVAQVFPREPVFDVLIFDEASQLRLEEALPVLTRAKRVVIAGDPKQLPPTRFFEAAVADSDTVEIETEDDLFEAQQAEAEDLLSAALNLSVEESHLNVHYRSHNADLIGFSNEYFYSGRLQAIPGHPANIAKTPPLKIRRANGIYAKGLNPIEAETVVDLVVDLLNQKKPPSIGIATFNLSQRDLIFESLNERAEQDATFGEKLSVARERIGDGSFEGLFVKNLENVQGDERDIIIISTTYGKNDQGKFYRRFGPLAMPGGGRRLNVLVTRARKEVHLVTSIPSEAYNHPEALPEGTTPSGSWLLFAYLRYAKQIAELYESDETAPALDQEALGHVVTQPTSQPSDFVSALGHKAAQTHDHNANLYWGNDGFCVDIALESRGELSTTYGVLTDFTRFDGAPDPIEWDIYRTGILKWQGWTFNRVWTPHFVRDPKRTLNDIKQ